MLAKIVSASASAAAKLYVEDVFSTWLYTGNGSTQTITNGIDLSGKGGLVWIKSRSNATENILYDTNRGPRKYVYTNSSAAESTTGSGFGLTAFNATGFDLGLTNNDNSSSTTYASWTFRKAAKFFDVVTYTGNGAASRYISHNLGSVPGCIIVKRTDSTGNWRIYHQSLGNNAYILLNSTSATVYGSDSWNFTDPTSTQFRINSDWDINQNGGAYVAYLFAHDAGGFGDSGNESVVKCGSYTGNGASTGIGQGLQVNLGWEPQWVLVKSSSGSYGWYMADNMRGMFGNGANGVSLSPHVSDAEMTYGVVTPNATGFTIDQSDNSINQNGGNYIYIAIRRGPMKTPTDATKVFVPIAYTGNSSANSTVQNLTTNIAADTAWITDRTIGQNKQSFDKIRGTGVVLYHNTTGAEQDFTAAYPPSSVFFNNTQTVLTGRYTQNGSYNSAGDTFIAYNFRRAPGFFDVVAYTGNGSSSDRNITHNLQVRPEMAIIKCRSSSAYWPVWHKAITGGGTYGTNYNLGLNTANGKVLGQDFSVIGNTDFTASTFPVMNAGASNSNGATYIAYLFASCPGVSSVGSYTGTGTTLSVDCGFTNGARFVLIKRIDSTGDWYVWDTARGIVSGNDPYLLLNSIAAEVTNTDYIDPLSSGFQISSTAPAAINSNGGTFLYLAIA